MADNFNTNDRPFGGGTVVQIQESTTTAFASTTTVMPLDDTIPQITEGAEFLTVTITPESTSNRLIITGQLMGAITGGSVPVMAIFRDAVADAIAAIVPDGPGAADNRVTLFISHNLLAPSTSAITFRLRAGPSIAATTLGINGSLAARQMGGVASSFLRVMEFTP